MEKNNVQAKHEKCYSDSSPSKTTVTWCYADFKRDHTNTSNAERSGRKLKLRERERERESRGIEDIGRQCIHQKVDGVMFIIVGNGHGDTSSNPGRD